MPSNRRLPPFCYRQTAHAKGIVLWRLWHVERSESWDFPAFC